MVRRRISQSDRDAWQRSGLASGTNEQRRKQTQAEDREKARIKTLEKEQRAARKKQTPTRAIKPTYGISTTYAGHKLNEFDVVADNWHRQHVGKTTAWGRLGVRKAKRDITDAYHGSRMHFYLYNRTRRHIPKR
jgi:hypothetical protein